MVTAYDTVTARLAERTGATGRNDMWPCPAHNDHNPSLSVKQGRDGVVMYCHAGCSTENVVAALDLDMKGLFDKLASNGHTEIVATYNYTDENGDLLFQVVRYAGKQFKQRRPHAGGGWIWSLGETRRVLYRLPEVVTAVAEGRTVYIVEGEKDADRLAAEGHTATCNPHGAGKWHSRYNPTLKGAHVVIVADRDEPGRTHAAYVAGQLEGTAADVRVVEAIAGKDVSDHLAAGHTVDQLAPQSDDERVSPNEDADPFLNWHELFTEEEPETQWLYEDVFALGRGHALYAGHKQGKSLFTLWVCAELATTRDDVDIIYLDYEMSRADVRERMEDMGHGLDDAAKLQARFHYNLLPRLPALNTGEGAAALLQLVDQVQRPDCHVLVVVDTTSRAAQGKENDSDTYIEFYRWSGIALKRRGVTWVRVDHAGKDEDRGQRGSSSKGDDVDVIWKLTAGQNGVKLEKDAARMGWVEDVVMFAIRTDPLRYVRGYVDPDGTNKLIVELDRLNVPMDAGRPTARKILREAGVKAPNNVLSAALRGRRIDAQWATELVQDQEKVRAPEGDELSVLDHGQPKSQVDGQPTDSDGQHPQTPTSEHVQLSTDSFGQPSEVAVRCSVPLGTDSADAATDTGVDLPCLVCSGAPHDTTTHMYVADDGTPF